MRDDKDHNERLDDFSGYMRQRLEEHRLPVDTGCWDEVEARMNRRARPRGWLWTGGLVVAAVLALVIWLLPSPEKMPLEELSPFQKEISEKAEEMNILSDVNVPVKFPEYISKSWNRKHLSLLFEYTHKLQRYCPASYPYPEFLKHLEKQTAGSSQIDRKKTLFHGN